MAGIGTERREVEFEPLPDTPVPEPVPSPAEQPADVPAGEPTPA